MRAPGVFGKCAMQFELIFTIANLALLNGIAIYSNAPSNKKLPRHRCTNLAVFYLLPEVGPKFCKCKVSANKPCHYICMAMYVRVVLCTL